VTFHPGVSLASSSNDDCLTAREKTLFAAHAPFLALEETAAPAAPPLASIPHARARAPVHLHLALDGVPAAPGVAWST
jgi:hypothetical protein